MAVRISERTSPRSGGAAVHIAPMRRRHLRAVMRIETRSYPRPWSVALFMSELSSRTTRDYFVAKIHGEVVGYAGMMVVGDEAHVTNIAVDPDARRQHIATRLMIQLLRAARRRGVKHMTLEVRMGNRAAQSMYFRFGFAPAGTRNNYYPETNEDALVMWVHDIDTDVYSHKVEAVAARISGPTGWV